MTNEIIDTDPVSRDTMQDEKVRELLSQDTVMVLGVYKDKDRVTLLGCVIKDRATLPGCVYKDTVTLFDYVSKEMTDQWGCRVRQGSNHSQCLSHWDACRQQFNVYALPGAT